GEGCQRERQSASECSLRRPCRRRPAAPCGCLTIATNGGADHAAAGRPSRWHSPSLNVHPHVAVPAAPLPTRRDAAQKLPSRTISASLRASARQSIAFHVKHPRSNSPREPATEGHGHRFAGSALARPESDANTVNGRARPAGDTIRNKPTTPKTSGVSGQRGSVRLKAK